MDVESAAWERHSTTRVIPPVQARKLAKVPFVELADGRLQGVVSSGSDIERVYVSSISAGTHGYSCGTNNNRPCGAVHSEPCKHLHLLVSEAILQYGIDRIARYLRVDVGDGVSTGAELMSRLHGQLERTPAAVVFSRFLRHLTYLELPETTEPLPELHWFPATAGAR